MAFSILDTSSSSAGELWGTDFLDDFIGWQELSLSFDHFYLTRPSNKVANRWQSGQASLSIGSMAKVK